MECLESDTDEKRASLLSILSKVHYKYIRKKKVVVVMNYNYCTCIHRMNLWL